MTIKTGSLHEDPSKFKILFGRIVNMRNFSGKNVFEKNKTHVLYPLNLSDNLAVYEICEKKRQ